MRRIAAALCVMLAAGAPAAVLVGRQGGYVTVPAQLNGAGPYSFILDTGAERSVVYQDLARERALPLVPGLRGRLSGQSGVADVALVRVDRLTLDGTTGRNLAVVRLSARRDRLPVGGIVGLDVIGRSLVDFDFRSGRVAVLPSGSGLAPQPTPGRRIRAERLRGGLIGLPVTINGTQGIALLDTGARDTRINSRFAAAGKLAIDANAPPRTIYDVTGNRAELRTARIAGATLGATRIGPTTVGVGDLGIFASFGLTGRPAMLLGMDWLADKRLVVDFAQGTLWFVP